MSKVENDTDHCPFCKLSLSQVSESIFKCSQCEADYYYVANPNVKNSIISFNTEKYSVQMYVNPSNSLTRVNLRDDRKVLFWLKETLNIEKYNAKRIQQKIDALIALS